MSSIESRQTVYINSHFRASGTDHDFTYSINLEPRAIFDKICLLQCSIPKSYYNCPAGQNTFNLIESGTTIPITVPPGNYTRVGLSVAISALLTAASTHSYTYTVSIPNNATGADNGKFIFTVSGSIGTQPILSFPAILPASISSLIFEMLGFSAGSANSFSANVLISTNVANLQPFNAIQIHCSLVSNMIQTGVNTDILQSIMANVGSAPYSNIQWVCPQVEAYSQDIVAGSTGTARFWLTDEDNIAINTNGVGCEFVIIVWKKSNLMRLIKGFIKYLTGFIMNIQSAEALPEPAESDT